MKSVKTPKFVINYEGKNITKDITPFLTSVRYTDKTEKESDDIEINLEDSNDLWLNEWFPEKGDKMQLSIGYDDNLVDCGTFEIDEIDVSGGSSGTEVSIRGIAAGITGALRTKKSSAHEKKSLRQIAETIAKNNGLTVQGQILDINFERITQNKETDLEFLHRISNEYGHVFSVRDNQITFTVIYDLEKGNPVLSIDRTEVIFFNLKDTSAKSYREAKVKYHNPKTRKVVEHTYNTVERVNKDGVTYKEVTKGDTLVITTKAENKQQAAAKAKAALYRANTKQQEGNFRVSGSVLVLAGNNVELTGFGQISGLYHIVESSHEISKYGGYVTNAKVKRVGYIEKEKHKRKKKKKDSNYKIEKIK